MSEARWKEYFEKSKDRPVSGLLLKALEGRSPGHALDLGCGAGSDTLELLHRGWTVHAVDVSTEAIGILRAEASTLGVDGALKTEVARFEDLSLPLHAYDLVHAAYSLPFCRPGHFEGI